MTIIKKIIIFLLLLFSLYQITPKIQKQFNIKQLSDEIKLIKYYKYSYTFHQLGNSFITPAIQFTVLSIPLFGTTYNCYRQLQYHKSQNYYNDYNDNTNIKNNSAVYFNSVYNIWLSMFVLDLSIGSVFSLSSLILLSISDFYELKINNLILKKPELKNKPIPDKLKIWSFKKKLSRLSLLLLINGSFVLSEGIALFAYWNYISWSIKQTSSISHKNLSYNEEFSKLNIGYYEYYWSALSILIIGSVIEISSFILFLVSKTINHLPRKKNKILPILAIQDNKPLLGLNFKF